MMSTVDPRWQCISGCLSAAVCKYQRSHVDFGDRCLISEEDEKAKLLL